MKIALIKPGMGDIISGCNITDGRMEPLQLAIIDGLIKTHPNLSKEDFTFSNFFNFYLYPFVPALRDFVKSFLNFYLVYLF